MISNKIDIGSLLFVKSHSLHLMQEDNEMVGVAVALHFIMGFLLYVFFYKWLRLQLLDGTTTSYMGIWYSMKVTGKKWK